VKQRIWTSDWFAGLVYGAVFLRVAYVLFAGTFQRLETAAYDLGVHRTHATPNNQIAVIAIDNASICKMANETQAPATSLHPELPFCPDTLMDKALQKDPDPRYQRGMEFANALRACAANLKV
jgi:CHASE2 domain-containing sensor protein